MQVRAFERYIPLTGTMANGEDPNEMPQMRHFIRDCTVCKDKNNLQGQI